MGVHLAMIYSERNYINHKSILQNSMQLKSKFTHFLKNNFKNLIEQFNLKQ